MLLQNPYDVTTHHSTSTTIKRNEVHTEHSYMTQTYTVDMAKRTVFHPVHRWKQAAIMLLLLLIFVATANNNNNNVDGFAWKAPQRSFRVRSGGSSGSSHDSCGLQSTNTDTTNESNIPTTTTTTITTTTAQRPLCFYRSPTNGNRWTPRIELSNLVVGQELHGVIVQEKLTNTTTGPKVWLDVGVCRWSSRGIPHNRSNSNNNDTKVTTTTTSLPGGGWTIATAMLRLGNHHYGKESVMRKKVARLRNRDTIPVYVSRIRIDQGQFEVVLTPDDVPTPPPPVLQSVSTLGVGDEVTGTVTKLVDYGAFIKLDGYNRGGLLHIQQVAELYQTYIDRRQGLMDSGLTVRSRVRLQVKEKGPSRRIFLDFTNDVKQMAREEQRQEQQEMERQQNELRAQLQQQRTAKITTEESNPTEEPEEYDASRRVDDSSIVVNVDDQDDIEEADIQEEEEEQEDDVYDDYDEQREIEDALGLGMY